MRPRLAAVVAALFAFAPALVPASAVVAAGAPLAGAAPALNLGDFADRGHYRNGNGTVTFKLELQTKLAGDVFWYETDVLVMPDNAYTRWAVADAMDLAFRRTDAWHVDPKILACCVRAGHTDETGAATIDGLPAGRYVLFVGVDTVSNAWTPAFKPYDGLDAHGDPAQAQIPTIAFPNAATEELFVESPFAISAAPETITVPLHVVADEVRSP